MSERKERDGAWFAAKTHGYGAGLPIAWQGWVVLGVYSVVAALSAWLSAAFPRVGPIFAIVLMAIATIALIAISARTTRGGWRWRWGRDS